jgi:hypothetical protein
VAFGCPDCPPARKAARSSASSRDRGERWNTGDLPDSRKDGRSWIALSFPSSAWISPRVVNQSATITGQHRVRMVTCRTIRRSPPRLIEGARLLAVTSRVSAIVPANPNANTNSEETASRPAVVDAHNEAMVAELRAQIAQLNERVARGLGRLDALRSTDAHRIDREITPRTEQRKTLAP